jgi:hypothetical protein
MQLCDIPTSTDIISYLRGLVRRASIDKFAGAGAFFAGLAAFLGFHFGGVLILNPSMLL